MSIYDFEKVKPWCFWINCYIWLEAIIKYLVPFVLKLLCKMFDYVQRNPGIEPS